MTVRVGQQFAGGDDQDEQKPCDDGTSSGRLRWRLIDHARGRYVVSKVKARTIAISLRQAMPARIREKHKSRASVRARLPQGVFRLASPIRLDQRLRRR